MKRRLTKAYDAMTMPDRCSDAILQRLQLEQEIRETGENKKLVTPVSRKKPWLAAIGAVCAAVVLSVCGSLLFLYGSQSMLAAPTEAVAAEGEKTPEDHYAAATQLTVEEVETFAKIVRSNILTENWTALGDKIQYPIIIKGSEIDNAQEFVARMEELRLGSQVREALEQETCTAMPCTADGIWMGEGMVRIREGNLRMLKIVDFAWQAADASDYTFMREPDGTEYYHDYSGREETVVFPDPYGVIDATTVGTGMPVILYGDIVKTITIGETITAIGDYAFSNCPALEAVFFRGDAPAEAEGVFEGSENVTVYYVEGTSGWGKTWCGRETKSTTRLGITIEAANALEQQKKANEAFQKVLEGGTFLDLTDLEEATLAEHCEKRQARYGKKATISGFTMVDMDGDGIKELVCRVALKNHIGEKYLILRWEDGQVRGYSPEMQISELKKDGSFYWVYDAQNQGDTVMEFRDGYMSLSDAPRTEQGRVPVLWHNYPCERSDLVLASYAYVSGTGQSIFPGTPYSVFELLVQGTMDNDWEMVKKMLIQWGMVCEEAEGSVSVYDPDAPGTALYGILTEKKTRLAEVGFYISTEAQEYQAVVREMTSGSPKYWVDGTRQVSTAQDLIAYFDPVKEW